MPSYFVEVWSLLGVKQNLSQAQIGLLYFRLSSLHCLFHMVKEVKAVVHSTDSYIAPFNEIRIPKRRKFLLVECRIREMGALQLWNLEYSSRNPESDHATVAIQNPRSTDKDRNPVRGIWNPQRGIQNPRLPLIPLH